ncbi:hypothetical protein YQE_12436, partial [Dendroctonus ponderosae]
MAMNKCRRRYPVSCGRNQQDQPKGVIVCWPSLKKVHNWATLKLIVWFAAQALYFLYITGILPSGRSIPLKRPPWSLEQRAKFAQLIVMKEQTNSKSQLNNQREQEVVERGTFSRWLSSEEGLENLKLFINTLLCFVLVC